MTRRMKDALLILAGLVSGVLFWVMAGPLNTEYGPANVTPENCAINCTGDHVVW